MIYEREELQNFIKGVLGDGEIIFKPLHATGNMTARLEDGGAETLICVEHAGKEYVVKMKSVGFDKNVCDAMNYFDDDSFVEIFEKGKYIFYIRDSYDREQKIYSALKDYEQYFPKIYGASSDERRSVIIMEKLEVDRTPPKDLPKVMSKIHSFCTSERVARELGANVHEKSDYENATELSLELLKNVGRARKDFPEYILEKAREFVLNYRDNYEKMLSFGRCLCHGDLTINNLTSATGTRLYDLELATFNNVEFDLVSYLVHYPTELNEEIVYDFLSSYYKESGFSLKERESAIKFNLLLYLTTRFHAMMLISLKLDMPYMVTSIKNYIFLFNLFNLSSY